MSKKVTVVGGGLAGTECAYQLATAFERENLDISVELYEMRPVKNTPAHHTDNLAELVCSNSLGSEFLTTARGVLIHEMQEFDSVIIDSAIKSKVPAGQALAVDRDEFAKLLTEKVTEHPRIKLIREELKQIPETNEENLFTVIASGPLTSPDLAADIQKQTEFLYFFDAASPILTAESVNMDIAFKASRYGKGDEGKPQESEGDYINCPFYTKEEYENFYHELMNAQKAEQKDFEKESMKKTKFFEGCMPIEEIARRGIDTMRFGPLKPVGLTDLRHPDKKAYAVVQLRQDNVIGSLYNIVGFQTNLKWGEQKRVFSMIPGLENVDIVRYGVMHQNIYLNSPMYLNANLSLKKNPKVFFAGQITGVEGYTESAATGIIAARNIIAELTDKAFELPVFTMMGALSNYIANAEAKHFQPMNSNWGLINVQTESLDKKLRRDKKKRNEFLANRAIDKTKELV